MCRERQGPARRRTRCPRQLRRPARAAEKPHARQKARAGPKRSFAWWLALFLHILELALTMLLACRGLRFAKYFQWIEFGWEMQKVYARTYKQSDANHLGRGNVFPTTNHGRGPIALLYSLRSITCQVGFFGCSRGYLLAALC